VQPEQLDEVASSERYTLSVVVPAHNEETRGFRALELLESAASNEDWLILVICNGCNDGTAELARRSGRLKVVEVETAGKSNALNVGDHLAGDVYPRIYLDADVDTTVESIKAIARALQSQSYLAVGPGVRYDTRNCSWLVRSYYSSLLNLPFQREYLEKHLQGRGVYGTTEAGRRRFSKFPDLRADDAFFDHLFGPDEKCVVEEAQVTISPPNSSREFLHQQTRSVTGTNELNAWIAAQDSVPMKDAPPTTSRLSFKIRMGLLPSHPSFETLTNMVGYLIVELITRSRSALFRRTGRQVHWR
jgi:hypothetical protein